MNEGNAADLCALLQNDRYPGRGIAAGTDESGKRAVAVYFIMGRSDNSRNRVFRTNEKGDLFTAPFDRSAVLDPSLILYTAMRRTEGSLIVSNGDQTDTIASFLAQGKTFEDALRTRSFEPDAPNFTPRISALLRLDGGAPFCRMSILKNVDGGGNACGRFFFDYEAERGIGHFIHTYSGENGRLLPFEGEPKRVLLPGTIDALSSSIWGALDPDNRISLHVRFIDLETGREERRTINKLDGGAE